MTTVGHSLTGMAIGALVIPPQWGWPAKAAAFFAFAFLANLPDAPLPGWGHDKYQLSHSIFVNLAIIIPLAGVLACWSGLLVRIGGWPVAIGGAGAWLSHMLLDAMYSHGSGIRAFWPFSKAALDLPVPWLHTLRRGWAADWYTLRVALIELASFGVLLALCWAARVIWVRMRITVPGAT